MAQTHDVWIKVMKQKQIRYEIALASNNRQVAKGKKQIWDTVRKGLF